jgi:hypothetical protein
MCMSKDSTDADRTKEKKSTNCLQQPMFPPHKKDQYQVTGTNSLAKVTNNNRINAHKTHTTMSCAYMENKSG